MIVIEPDGSRFVVTEEPVRIRFESEAYILVQPRGYVPAANIICIKTKKRGYLLLGAMSMCEQLERIRRDNLGNIPGVEIWIRKAGIERASKYIIKE